MASISSLNKLVACSNGNTLWYPAFNLPNCKVRIFEESSNPLGLKSSVTIDKAVNKRPVEIGVGNQSTKTSSVAELPHDESTLPIVSPISESSLLAPFSLSLSVSENLLIIDTLGTDVAAVPTHLVMQLTTAIHRCRLGQLPVKFSTLNWPMHNHPYAPRDEASAKSILSDLLVENLHGCAIKDVLICGDMSVRLVGEDADISHLLGISGANIYRYDRISSVLFDVSKKRKLWELFTCG